jgi:hypothetical protein
MNTQNAQVLAWMKSGNEITSLEAFINFKITRLAARVYEIRSTGVEVDDRWITTSEGKRYKAYRVKA